MSTEKTPPPVILGRYAGFFSRGAAFVLDRLIAFGIAFVILAVVHYLVNLFRLDQWLESLVQDLMLNPILALLFSSLGIYLLVSTGYDIVFWLLSGQTLGKRALGLRVMRTDGTRLSLGNALLRQVGYLVSAIFFLGFLWILVDNRRQGFHDKLAGTIVTYSWPKGRLRGTFVIKQVQRFADRRTKT